MMYTGDTDDRCAISFAFVNELENPVGFESSHAYECDSLLEWLKVRPTNPITAQEIQCDALIVDIIHPLIVQNDRRHLESTWAKLAQAGRVCSQQGKKHITVTTMMMLMHTILHTIFTYYASLYRIDPPVTVLGSGITIMSFAWFCSDTIQNYKVNGKWIVFNFVLVAFFVHFLIEITGVCSPRMYTIVKIMIWHSAMLAMRFLFDMNRICCNAQIE